MAEFEQRDMSGALFKNERKTKDNQPDYTGSATIEGKQWFIAAWLKKSAAGKVYMSLAFSEPREGKKIDDSDDIPF